MKQASTQTGSPESAYTEGYNRGTEMGSNLVKVATDVAHSTLESTIHVVNEGVKSIEEILHEGEQKTVNVSSKIGEVIEEGVKSVQRTLIEGEHTVESAYTEALSKGSDFVTKVGEAVEHSVKVAESTIHEGYTHSVDTATEACTKVTEVSGQVASATVHTVSEGVKSAQNVLKQTKENYDETIHKGIDLATTVGTKAAEFAGEIVGGTVQTAEEMLNLVNKAVVYDGTEEILMSTVE